MGSTDSKLNFRKAVIQLTTKTQVSFAPSVHKAKCWVEILWAGARRRASPWRWENASDAKEKGGLRCLRDFPLSN